MIPKVVHCNVEPYDVYIGRGSKFGNPFTHLKNTLAPYPVDSREDAIRAYEYWIQEPSQSELLLAIKSELKNKTLGCWCSPLACHGDILLLIANEE